MPKVRPLHLLRAKIKMLLLAGVAPFSRHLQNHHSSVDSPLVLLHYRQNLHLQCQCVHISATNDARLHLSELPFMLFIGKEKVFVCNGDCDRECQLSIPVFPSSFAPVFRRALQCLQFGQWLNLVFCLPRFRFFPSVWGMFNCPVLLRTRVFFALVHGVVKLFLLSASFPFSLHFLVSSSCARGFRLQRAELKNMLQRPVAPSGVGLSFEARTKSRAQLCRA